jgi:hypothetical protein
MKPTTYFCATRNNTFEVQIFPVQPQWAIAPFAKFRCCIGVWNFQCTHFVEIAQGQGNTEKEAFESAVNDSKLH